MDNTTTKNWWNMELEGMPDFDSSMKRIYAWYEREIIDRPPVRFSAHNSFVNEKSIKGSWDSIRDKWFDTEYQVEAYIKSIQGKIFLGETFPVFWPNLGPNVFASFYGLDLEFDEVTSWAEPKIDDYSKLKEIKLNMNNEYFNKIENLTEYALQRCSGKFMVGYTDLHPGLDCAAALRDTQELCFDIFENPQEMKELISISSRDFHRVYNHFDTMLKLNNQLSVTWMNIPSFGKMHIPSCDFSAMISPKQFEEFYLPILQQEVKGMTHNIFHLDGKGVARQLDYILEIPEITAIQWVQGLGEDKPIMQWIPLIKKIRAAGKAVVVDLEKHELEGFIAEVDPEGILICIKSDSEIEQREILKRIERW